MIILNFIFLCYLFDNGIDQQFVKIKYYVYLCKFKKTALLVISKNIAINILSKWNQNGKDFHLDSHVLSTILFANVSVY